MMNIYQEWGFKDSPFKTTALPPSDLGSRLLVGRDGELKALLRRLYNPPKIVTIEGLNGVGKTSLVNVAAYKAYEAYLDEKSDCLFIPCCQTFQLKPNQNAEAFIDEVLMAVAQTLIDEAKRVNTVYENIKTDSLNKWLNSPQIQTLQGSISILAVGGGGGITAETNTSTGFERSGFRKEVLRWLSELFPSPQDGGVICTIDNLELLQTSEAARKLLEQLRDELLTVPGLRWVLCGALGIVLGTASSPRLEGFLHTPIEISGVDEALASEILSSRIETFAVDTQLYIPLLSQDFESLYDVLNRNLRSVLGRADNYCQWVADQNLPDNDIQKHQFFEEWLDIESDRAYKSVTDQLRRPAWDVFKKAVLLSGVFSPSDYEEFGFNSSSAMRPYVKDLEDAGLLVSTQDEGDKRRKTIQILPKGWLVNYALGKSA